ncbi:voltage-gated potassium channel [Poronia punctata]|nr:voltage-gated potassium channel [Poronia punctata]
MDDAGLNDNVGDHTEVVESSRGEDGYGREGQHAAETEEMHLNPTHWYFASTIFPMVAGALGPVASAFSICALVKHWRQHVPPGSNLSEAVFVDDPPWLLAINAVQLGIAVVANVFLLLNMTKRVSFSIAQPVTIVGWYLSSFLLIALCATASGPLLLKPEAEYIWSQAFFYGLFAAILYFIVASLMLLTVIGAYAGHYPMDFELSVSQRTLMLQTIMFLVYLLLGALVFSHIEGWLYLDAVYWADYTLFTVGLGDISLQTKLGRGLMIPYALIGITTLGLVIGSIRSLMLDRGKSRIDARILEKRRRRFVRKYLRSNGKKKSKSTPDGRTDDGSSNCSPEQKSAGPDAELERRYAEFHLMRKIQNQASQRRRWTALGISGSTWVVLWLVGARIFQASETPYQNWTYFDAIYFSFQAMSTVGYGDLTPVSNSGKAFFVFWSLLALPTLTVLISNAGDTIIKLVRDATLLLGNITILPGESGFRKDIKHIMSRLSFGRLFVEESIHESPPGFLGAAEPRSDESEDDEDEYEDDDEDEDENALGSLPRVNGGNSAKSGPTQSVSNYDASSKRRNSNDLESAPSRQKDTNKKKNNKTERQEGRKRESSERLDDLPQTLPKTSAEFHLVLIDEIRRVSQHLQHSPPRKYSYKEWAWYLRLIGEDESNVATHHEPLGHPHSLNKERMPQPADGHGIGASSADNRDGSPKWSWVGHRSPLMDTRKEAEWILDKLTERLRQELVSAVESRKGNQGARSAAKLERRHHDGNQAH